MEREIIYNIFDPAGNITALVESIVDISDQKDIADIIMQQHPEVEQVGFVDLNPEGEADVSLRMTGGEFCGNATVCAAMLWAVRNDVATAAKIKVNSSGAKDIVEVMLGGKEDDSSIENLRSAEVSMPKAIYVSKREFTFGDIAEELPAVIFDGITHVIIKENTKFFLIKSCKEKAEAAVSEICEELGAPGLGLMFVDDLRSDAAGNYSCNLTPLVYVPASDTCFWENSCASGSTAIGEYLSSEDKNFSSVKVSTAGGEITVII